MGTVIYDKDVVFWVQKQARLLCSDRFSEFDIERLVDFSKSWRWTPQEVPDSDFWLR